MAMPDAESPRARRRARTRTVILRAAEELLAEGGLQLVTLANIAKRAAYSKPAIYEYFVGLEDILIELSREGFIRLGERVTAIDAGLAPEARLLAVCRAMLQFAAENAELYQLMFTHIIFTNNGLDRDWQALRAQTQVAYTTAAEVIQQGIAAGVFKPRPDFDGGAMLYMCWTMLHGMASLKRDLVREVGLDVDTYQAAMFALMLNNLKGVAPGGTD